MASIDQGCFVFVLSSLDRAVEFGFDLFRQFVCQRVEGFGLGLVLAEYRYVQLVTNLLELGVYLGNGLHVYADVDAQLLAEYIDQFDGWSGGPSCEIPAVGVDHIDTGHDSSQYGCQAVSRCTVGMEVNGDVQVLLEEFDQTADPVGRDQTRHVLDGDHVGTEGLHLFGFSEEVFVGKYRFRFLLAHQFGEESRFGVFRIDRITYGAVSHTTVLFDVFDRRLDVVHVVQGIEDTHDIQAAFDGVPTESVDDLVRIGRISEKVSTAGEGCQFRSVAHGFVDCFETGPGVLVQIAHDRIGNGSAPHLHGIEVCVFIERKTTVYLGLTHSCRERRLLAVSQR